MFDKINIFTMINIAGLNLLPFGDISVYPHSVALWRLLITYCLHC